MEFKNKKLNKSKDFYLKKLKELEEIQALANEKILANVQNTIFNGFCNKLKSDVKAEITASKKLDIVDKFIKDCLGEKSKPQQRQELTMYIHDLIKYDDIVLTLTDIEKKELQDKINKSKEKENKEKEERKAKREAKKQSSETPKNDDKIDNKDKNEVKKTLSKTPKTDKPKPQVPPVAKSVPSNNTVVLPNATAQQSQQVPPVEQVQSSDDIAKELINLSLQDKNKTEIKK